MKAPKTKKGESRPVPIVHMRLDYQIAKGKPEELKRIKEINRYLGAGETALTEIKMRGSPLSLLLERRAIGGEEFMAAQDIELAFNAIAGALMFRPMSMDRVDHGNGQGTPNGKTTDAMKRYQSWANIWSERAKRGDKTLEIVVGAIIDMRAFSAIDADIGLRHGLAKAATVRGLRDYAARAGWADKQQTNKWQMEAMESFPCRAGRVAV